MSNTRIPTHSGMGLPSLREVTSLAVVAQPLAVGNVTLNTLATMAAMDNPVTLNASVQLIGTNGAGSIARGVSLKLFRNGVEILITDRYVESVLDGVAVATVMSCHWTDEAPGKNPIYTLVAECTSTTITAVNRRLTGRL